MDNPNIWSLRSGQVYDFLSDIYVDIPEGYVGWLHTRSTLNRNGLVVHSGIYDSGFRGNLGGMLYNFGGPASLEPGVCIAQFILAQSDSAGLYQGSYNTADGELPEQLEGKIHGYRSN